MTVLHIMFWIYVVSIPACYILLNRVFKIEGREYFEEKSPYSLSYLTHIAAWFPVFNTLISFASIKYLISVALYEDDEEDNNGITIDDLRPKK